MKKNLQIILIAFLVFAIDRILKIAGIQGCFTLLCFSQSRNTGAAFGLFPGAMWVFIIAAIAVIFLALFYYKKIKSSMARLGLALIIAGTLSNFIDRAAFGYVIDYIRFIFHSNLFNIADLSNLAGAIMLVIGLVREKKITVSK